MAYKLSLCAAALLLRTVSTDTSLFNGGQELVFDDAPSGCLAAFDKPLACENKVRVLGYDLDSLEFTQASLSALCTDSCERSLLELKDSVSATCGDYDTDFNGAYISAVEVVDLSTYEYTMSCLADSSDDFCLLVEETWDVDSLNASGRATWPTNVEKLYPDFSDGNWNGSPAEDVDGNLLDQSDDPISWPASASDLDLKDAGEDYFLDPISPNWRGHGYDSALEYDEYPLEIQCSTCFLAQYRHGIESKWGEVYEEVQYHMSAKQMANDV
jgi:hypothetical protein